jgi:hypothetical protein
MSNHSFGMASAASGLDWQEANQLKPIIRPPPATVVVFRNERLLYEVLRIVMVLFF